MELIFEIGCEDLPARFVDPALEQLEELFVEACEDRRIEVDGIETVGTPRRLTLLVENLVEQQRSVTRTTEGPPADVGVDDAGDWTGAAKSFAESQGGTTDDLFLTDDGERVAIEVDLSGDPTSELLPEMLDGVLHSLEFPKSMRWAGYDERFGRPVRWLVAVAGGEVVPLAFAGAESSAETRGHRFAAPEPIDVRSIEEYREGLEGAHVTVDPDERRRQIEESLEEMAESVGGRVVDDPDLVDEVVHLIEEPHATRLDFSEEYLELPDEVLIESMRSHQRYFAIESEEGDRLLPHCGVIYNTPVEDPDVVNRGNLRVLRARLDDGTFFWNKDLQRSLESRREDLEDVVWLEQIGSIRARTDRIGATAEALAERFELEGEAADHARRAGELSKSDLVTEMVEEFPTLQGVMGREYARRDGEPDEVAVAIYEQYLPGGAGGELPSTDAGACVALAEKLDALVGCFGVEMEPTASSDPYGLRRAALGIIRILEDRGFSVELERLVVAACESYAEQGVALEVEEAELTENVVGFLERRLNFYLRDDYPTDYVEAVLAANPHEDRSPAVHEVRDRLDALLQYRGDPEFEQLVEGYKRVANILRDEAIDASEAEPPEPNRFESEAERELYESARASHEAMDTGVRHADWTSGADAVISLKDPIDSFFESVRVNAEDPELRRNRMRLLAYVERLFGRFADVSKIG